MITDELRAAAARYKANDYFGEIAGLGGGVIRDKTMLADFALAMLDETPLDTGWVDRVLNEPDSTSGHDDMWWSHPKHNGGGLYWDGEQWYGYAEDDDEEPWLPRTRADALAFLKLVGWPVEISKILEAAKT